MDEKEGLGSFDDLMLLLYDNKRLFGSRLPSIPDSASVRFRDGSGVVMNNHVYGYNGHYSVSLCLKSFIPPKLYRP